MRRLTVCLAVVSLFCSPLALAQISPPPPEPWPEVNALMKDQRYEEASRELEKHLAQAKKANDVEAWTRALVRLADLRTAMGSAEQACERLRSETWPKGAKARAVLDLAYANALLNFTRSDGYRLRQREAQTGKAGDEFQNWNYDRVVAEAYKTLADAFSLRAELGKYALEDVSPYIQPNNYPNGIRGTVRDAVSYLIAGALDDTSAWTAEQSNQVELLPLETLLTPPKDAQAALADLSLHPLVRQSAVLKELSLWHQSQGRAEAAFEAERQRLDYLFSHLPDEDDRAKLRSAMEAALGAVAKKPWWAMGKATLAGWAQQSDDPVGARDHARAGAQAFPDSVGGKQCAWILFQVESPRFSLDGMVEDAPGKRSIRVVHMNAQKLFFRAYKTDVEKALARRGGRGDFFPAEEEIEALVKGGAPSESWEVQLPATPDLKDHNTYVTPPMKAHGAYVVIASLTADPRAAGAMPKALRYFVTDLAALVDQQPWNVINVRALSGVTGQPIAGVKVRLFDQRWDPDRLEVLATQTSGADGRVRIGRPSGERDELFVLLSKGDDYALTSTGYLDIPYSEQRPPVSALVYTDRAVYRPEQKVLWKVVAYESRNLSRGDARIAANASVLVQLFDANGQSVSEKRVKTNAYGSAAGEFAVPAGRLLGNWSIRTRPDGYANIRVEEYKRPTFEVALDKPKEALRLNRPAAISGNAKYYFGLPLTKGDVRWTVRREPRYPWFWSYFRGGIGDQRAETIASGRATLKPDGTFGFTFTPAADERKAKGTGLSYLYRVNVDVLDEGGETRSATNVFTLGFVAVEAHLALAPGFFEAGDKLEPIQVLRTDLDGVPRAGKGSWSLVTLKPPKNGMLPSDLPPTPLRLAEQFPWLPKPLTPGDALAPRWQELSNRQEVLLRYEDGKQVASGELSHGVDGGAKLQLPELPAGLYRLKYSTPDGFGATATAEESFVVASAKERLPLAIELSVKDGTVSVGKKARVLAMSGLPDQELELILTRRGGKVERRKLDAKSAAIFEIPIRAEDRGGISLTLRGVRDHQLLERTAEIDVPWEDKELELSFSTFRDEVRTGTDQTFSVQVRSLDGKPVEPRAAEVLAYMYDRSLDLFGAPNNPTFTGLFPMNETYVETVDSLGSTYALHLFTGLGAWPQSPPPPELQPDRWRSLSWWSIGGPGVRARFAERRMNTIQVIRGHADESGGRPMRELSEAPGEAADEKKKDGNEGGIVGGLGGAVAAKKSTEAPVAIRSEFAETAFFLPQLLTGADGTATIQFHVPDSVTAWNLWAIATTKDLRSGSTVRELKSINPLMVREYLPRLLREGDQLEVRVAVNNATEKELRGTLTFEATDPATGKTMSAALKLDTTPRSFTVKGKGSEAFAYRLSVPPSLGQVQFKAVVKSGELSDGESRTIPILPSRMHLAASRFTVIKGPATETLDFNDLGPDKTRETEKLVVTVDSQLFQSVLSATPYLVEYPYECTEQTLNRFLSTGILSSVFAKYPSVAAMAKEFSARKTQYEAFDQPDPNRRTMLEEAPWLAEAKGGEVELARLHRVLDPQLAAKDRDSALAELQKAQMSDGAFPWFEGGPPSPYMTLYLLMGFARAAEFGVQVPPAMTTRAFGYVVRSFSDELKEKNPSLELLTLLAYVMSTSPEAQWSQIPGAKDVSQRALQYSFAHWRELSPYLKSMLSVSLERAKRHGDAMQVFASVMDTAKSDPKLGVYWQPDEHSWLWYNDTIETHAFALRTLTELSPKDPRRTGMVQWLFLNKKLSHWKSTRATAEVIYSLVHYLEAEKQLDDREIPTVTVKLATGEKTLRPEGQRPHQQWVIPPSDVGASPSVTVSKKSPAIAIASATWHFATDQLPNKSVGDLLNVERRYFLRVTEGKSTTLSPLAEGAKVKVGDEVEVQLKIRAKAAAEYIHLRDPRAAGFEPIALTSGYRYLTGLGFYEEVRDAGENFFFDWLPAGEYTLSYRVRATSAGIFRVGPATLQSMYAPEFTAYSAGHVLKVE